MWGRRRFACLAATGVLASVLGVAAAPPAAAATWTISGTVQSLTGDPVVGACVDVRQRDPSTGQQLYLATSGYGGAYRLVVPAGTYHVFFDPQCDSMSLPYTWQWWPGTTDENQAQPVTVQGDVTGIDARLAPGGSLSGTLSDQHGQPASGACVTIQDPTRPYQFRPTLKTTTDSMGRYAFDGLATAGYEVSYGRCDSLWSPEDYPGGSAPFQAQPVQVTAPAATVGVDATDVRLTTVTGRVTSTTDGTAMSATCVMAFGEPDATTSLMTTAPEADGTYTFPAVGRGHYQILAGSTLCPASFQSADTAETLYSATGDRANPTIIDVEGDPVAGIDMALPPGADMTGHVSGPDGQPAAGAEVEAYTDHATGDANMFLFHVQTDSAGNYVLRGLPTLSGVRVRFSDPSDKLLPTWYGGTSNSANSVPVNVSSGHTTSGIDGHLRSDADTTPPTVTVHLAGLTIPARATVTWQGSDESGIYSYDVEWARRSVGGTLGSWSALADATGTTATRSAFAVAPGYVYCVRARARDNEFNVSAWTAPMCTMHPVDDVAMHASAGWVVSHPRLAYLQSVHATKSLGETLSTPARHVRALYLFAYLCPSCGPVDLFVGRTRVAHLRLVASTARWGYLRVSLAASLSGTVTVRTTSRSLVDVDGIGAIDG